MRIEVREDSKNYVCSVVQIDKVFDIEGAGRIKRVVVFGNNVVVQNTVKEGDIMLYFVSGTELNEEYCFKNNLFEKSESNYDQTKRGFINSKRRVKAIKLRGVISDGMLMPLNSLSPFLEQGSINSLKVGDEFTTINGNVLCKKYIVKIKQTPGQGNSEKNKGKVKKFDRLVENQFYLHGDTSNLRKNMHNIHPDSVIGISYKKHGCSAVFANILTKKQLNWKEKLAKRFGVPVVEEVYDIIYSSRKVIKNKNINPEHGGGFYGEDIWGIVAKEVGHLIPKNYTLYGEILGYTPSGSYIQKNYDYGCQEGEHKFYVYKISVVNPDGQVIFLSDPQIEEFCEKVGLRFKDTVIYQGKAKDMYPNIILDHEWRDKFLARLEKEYNEKNCCMCVNKVPEEGIILRVDKLESYEAYKLKSKRFLLHESEEQEKEVVNIEDSYEY